MLENGMVVFTERKTRTVKVRRWVEQECEVEIYEDDDNEVAFEEARESGYWEDIQDDSYSIA